MKKISCKILVCMLAALMIIGLLPAGVFAAEDKPVYISQLMIAVGEDLPQAVDMLNACGYTSFGWNLYSGLNGYCALLGYKTTTVRSRAITDIKFMTTKANEMTDADIQYLYSGGKATYMVSPVYYTDMDAMGNSGIFGIGANAGNINGIENNVLDTLGYWGKRLTWDLFLKDFCLIGSLTDMFISWLLSANFTMGLYYTKNSAAGQPILLDGFHFSTDPTTPEGYDTATEFCSVEPFNVKSYCDKTLYLHFKRDGECTTIGNIEYLAELIYVETDGLEVRTGEGDMIYYSVSQQRAVEAGYTLWSVII